jgi:hypothetical protein
MPKSKSKTQKSKRGMSSMDEGKQRNTANKGSKATQSGR